MRYIVLKDPTGNFVLAQLYNVKANPDNPEKKIINIGEYVKDIGSTGR